MGQLQIQVLGWGELYGGLGEHGSTYKKANCFKLLPTEEQSLGDPDGRRREKSHSIAAV